MLELVIAFSLLSICALPLVRNPLRLLKAHFSSVEGAEISRLSALEFAAIKAELYRNSVEWETLSKPAPVGKEVPPPDKEDKITVSLIHPAKYIRKVYFWTVSDKEGQSGEELKLVNIRITFEKEKAQGEKKGKKYTFNWRTFVMRGTSSKK